MFFLTLLPFAFAQYDNAADGFQVAIKDATSFCLIMPPNPGDDIAATEREAISMCWNSPPGGKPRRTIPSGFIQSAHFGSF